MAHGPPTSQFVLSFAIASLDGNAFYRLLSGSILSVFILKTSQSMSVNKYNALTLYTLYVCYRENTLCIIHS